MTGPFVPSTPHFSSRAKAAGRKAFLDGYGIETCPHHPESINGEDWISGWKESQSGTYTPFVRNP